MRRRRRRRLRGSRFLLLCCSRIGECSIIRWLARSLCRSFIGVTDFKGEYKLILIKVDIYAVTLSGKSRGKFSRRGTSFSFVPLTSAVSAYLSMIGNVMEL